MRSLSSTLYTVIAQTNKPNCNHSILTPRDCFMSQFINKMKWTLTQTFTKESLVFKNGYTHKVKTFFTIIYFLKFVGSRSFLTVQKGGTSLNIF